MRSAGPVTSYAMSPHRQLPATTPSRTSRARACVTPPMRHLGRIFLVLRQGVGDRVPGRLRADEHWHCGRDVQVAQQIARGQEREIHFLQQRRRHRAARAAERRAGLSRRSDSCAMFDSPPQPAKRHQRRRDERCEGRAVVLAAHRAMAMDHHAERAADFIADGAAQAVPSSQRAWSWAWSRQSGLPKIAGARSVSGMADCCSDGDSCKTDRP